MGYYGLEALPEPKRSNGKLGPTMVRFFNSGGHDAGTGIYKDTPGVDVLITDKQRLQTLLITDRYTSLQTLRNPSIGAKFNDSLVDANSEVGHTETVEKMA